MLKILIQSAVIGAFAFALSIVVFSAWRSFYEQNHQANQETSGEETAKQSGHSTLNIATKERPEEAIARYNLWLMIFTGVLAFVALIQIGFLISADNTASNTARAAKESADAAKEAVELSNKTAERELRAYMGIANLGTRFEKFQTAEDKIIEGRVQIYTVNYGKTPAHNATLWARELDGPPIQFDYTEGNFVIRNQLVQPGQLFGRVAGERTPDNPFFIYGYVEYTDIFKNIWRYRFAYSFNSAWGGDRFQAHAEHNDEIYIGESPE
jgi:hypothetical protein